MCVICGVSERGFSWVVNEMIEFDRRKMMIEACNLCYLYYTQNRTRPQSMKHKLWAARWNNTANKKIIIVCNENIFRIID